MDHRKDVGDLASLLALMSVGCEVLGESVPFEKALHNVDEINANSYFCWEGLGLQAGCHQHRPVHWCLQNASCLVLFNLL